MSTATSPFSRKANNSEGGDYELPPTGQQPAVLVGLIDLGTHSFTYQGKTTDAHKMAYVWELVDPDERMKDGSPFVVLADFTISLAKKAKMRAMLEGWLGRSFGDDEAFDPLTLMGRNCVLNLTEGQTGTGKKFIEVASVASPMKGYAIPPSTLQQFVFMLDNHHTALDEPPIPAWVPRLYGKTVSDEIKASYEWGQLPQF